MKDDNLLLKNKRKTLDYKTRFIKTLLKCSDAHQTWKAFLCYATKKLNAPCILGKDEARIKSLDASIIKADKITLDRLFKYMILSLKENRHQDFLGDVYTECDFHTKERNQLLQPYYKYELLANVDLPDIKYRVEEGEMFDIYDPVCESGTKLIAIGNMMIDKELDLSRVVFYAQDSELDRALMTYIQLSLLGVVGKVEVKENLEKPDREMRLIDKGKSYVTSSSYDNYPNKLNEWNGSTVYKNKRKTVKNMEIFFERR